MKKLKPCLVSLALASVVILAGCAPSGAKAPEVSDSIRRGLDQANLKDVTVTQDREKGVVTLGGHVAADLDKSQAESIAKAAAGAQVVANQIAVIPPGREKDAKAVNSELDKGIGHNLEAAFIQSGPHDGVKFDVKNGVVTLKGEVVSQAARTQAQAVAAAVPNVQQVVNELQVKDQKASSSK